jgi:hypothetical protein
MLRDIPARKTGPAVANSAITTTVLLRGTELLVSSGDRGAALLRLSFLGHDQSPSIRKLSLVLTDLLPLDGPSFTRNPDIDVQCPNLVDQWFVLLTSPA